MQRETRTIEDTHVRGHVAEYVRGAVGHGDVHGRPALVVEVDRRDLPAVVELDVVRVVGEDVGVKDAHELVPGEDLGHHRPVGEY